MIRVNIERGTAEYPSYVLALAAAQHEIDRLKNELSKKELERWNWEQSAGHLTAERDAAVSRAEQAERNEAVCHCGSLARQHTMGEGHGAVEMRPECPYIHDIARLAKERDELSALIKSIAFMCEDGSRDELNVLALIKRNMPTP